MTAKICTSAVMGCIKTEDPLRCHKSDGAPRCRGNSTTLRYINPHGQAAACCPLIDFNVFWIKHTVCVNCIFGSFVEVKPADIDTRGHAVFSGMICEDKK